MSLCSSACSIPICHCLYVSRLIHTYVVCKSQPVILCVEAGLWVLLVHWWQQVSNPSHHSPSPQKWYSTEGPNLVWPCTVSLHYTLLSGSSIFFSVCVLSSICLPVCLCVCMQALPSTLSAPGCWPACTPEWFSCGTTAWGRSLTDTTNTMVGVVDPV